MAYVSGDACADTKNKLANVLFGEVNKEKRLAYAANFMILFYSLVKSYIVTHPGITGVGFPIPAYIYVATFAVSGQVMVKMGVPAFNLFGPCIQTFKGKKSMINNLPRFFRMHMYLLWFELFAIFIVKSFHVWLIATCLQQFLYGSIDLTLDQISLRPPADNNSDQAYRSNGGVIGLLLPTMALVVMPWMDMETSLVFITFVLTAILYFTSKFAKRLNYVRENPRDRRGRISLVNFVIIALMTLVMAVPDGVGDAISGQIARNHRNADLIVIKYSIMGIAWALTHPAIHTAISSEFSKYSSYAKGWPILLVLVRIALLYYYPEFNSWGYAELGFFSQALLDTTSGL